MHKQASVNAYETSEAKATQLKQEYQVFFASFLADAALLLSYFCSVKDR